MKTWECKECGKEVQNPKKPLQACSCGARGKWVEVALKWFHTGGDSYEGPRIERHAERPAEFWCGPFESFIEAKVDLVGQAQEMLSAARDWKRSSQALKEKKS